MAECLPPADAFFRDAFLVAWLFASEPCTLYWRDNDNPLLTARCFMPCISFPRRYKKPANWDLIKSVAAAPDAPPIIGNGDILTHYEASRRLSSGVHAALVGRGALIQPWIFEELRSGRELAPDAGMRVALYREFYGLMRDHFGDDDMGRRKAWYFAPWHHAFFHRYRSRPQDVYGAQSLEHPLISTRNDLYDPLLGEASVNDLNPVERLLRNENPSAHEAIAAVLWDSRNDAEALSALEKMQREEGEVWEAEMRNSDRVSDSDDRG
uniref:tRNA-dihydrouridine(47) synthase [NAD(P)(+)] n=2 Tax=Chlamydomonas euryale TaxID=1486919 RepID=A0A7R9VK75_9CHLO|mmetsp:Transcript_38056/g.112695  ORF Transcript_38056/g.112695 Transcript_38056/m.112695 type:complete len:267 (+) Transcript_38056:151-951(+)